MFSWYLRVLRKYAVFSGRARRREYWYFTLTNSAISFAIGLLGGIIEGETGASGSVAGFFGAVTLLYALAMFLPSLGVGIRRLHDSGKSGWWLLLNLVPIVGTIVMIVWLAKDGDEGSNRFGPSPKRDAGAPIVSVGLSAA